MCNHQSTCWKRNTFKLAGCCSFSFDVAMSTMCSGSWDFWWSSSAHGCPPKMLNSPTVISPPGIKLDNPSTLERNWPSFQMLSWMVIWEHCLISSASAILLWDPLIVLSNLADMLNWCIDFNNLLLKLTRWCVTAPNFRYEPHFCLFKVLVFMMWVWSCRHSATMHMTSERQLQFQHQLHFIDPFGMTPSGKF